MSVLDVDLRLRLACAMKMAADDGRARVEVADMRSALEQERPEVPGAVFPMDASPEMKQALARAGREAARRSGSVRCLVGVEDLRTVLDDSSPPGDAEEDANELPALVGVGFSYGILFAELPDTVAEWFGDLFPEMAAMVWSMAPYPRTPDRLAEAARVIAPLLVDVSLDETYRPNAAKETRVRLYVSEQLERQP